MKSMLRCKNNVGMNIEYIINLHIIAYYKMNLCVRKMTLLTLLAPVIITYCINKC